MEYCPYCSQALLKPAKVCPNCRKNIDIGLLAELVKPGETSKKNKKIKRKIWFREKMRLIIPIFTLLVGFIMGAIIINIYNVVQFANEKSSLESKIEELQSVIEKKNLETQNLGSDFQEQLTQKEEIIKIFAEQKDIMGRVINFTARLARNSTVTPNTTTDSDYYQRNISYLISLFEAEQEKLRAIEYTPVTPYPMITIPQLMEN
jgi:hypothetical protein